MMQKIRLHSKYVQNQTEDRRETYIQATTNWLEINKKYIESVLPGNEKLLFPIKQELDNLGELFEIIINYHERQK